MAQSIQVQYVVTQNVGNNLMGQMLQLHHKLFLLLFGQSVVY